MNDTDLDKLLDDIYQCGRTDATLNVDDYSKLKPGMKAALAALVARREALAEKRGRKDELERLKAEYLRVLQPGMARDFVLIPAIDDRLDALTTEATQGGKEGDS